MKTNNGIFARNQSGFSLVELLVCLGILGLLMAAVLSSFTKTMQQSAQQSSISETQIETGVGLDLLRADLEHAGFGLPWLLPGFPNPYSEALDSAFNHLGGDTLLAPLTDVPNVPKALSSSDGLGATPFISLNDSDYLVIRATNVLRGATGQKWGYVGRKGDHSVDVQPPGTFTSSDRVIVLRPEISPGAYRQLVLNGTTYIVDPTAAAMDNFAPSPTPNDPDGERYLVYGLDNNSSVNSRPFNRTDYFINDANVPSHCAPPTGVLVKATVPQTSVSFDPLLPIVDCVADFQIVYRLDSGAGVQTTVNANGLNGLSADQIRDQVKSVRCYILTHEGTLDRTYNYPNQKINVGEMKSDGSALETDAAGNKLGREFDLPSNIGGNWANYRWKVVSLAVTPKNLK